MNQKQREQQEAVDTLKQWGLVDGSTVYAKVNRVSASGMSRNISLYIASHGQVKKQGIAIIAESEIHEISYHAAKAMGWGYKEGYNGGIRVSGCGMDMLFHTIDTLSYAMGYGDICQDRDRSEPIEKNGINGGKIKAIGLKYKAL